jgi:hypothetical protein
MAEIIAKIDEAGNTVLIDAETLTPIEALKVQDGNVVEPNTGETVFVVSRDGEFFDAEGNPARVSFDPKTGEILINGKAYAPTKTPTDGGDKTPTDNGGGGFVTETEIVGRAQQRVAQGSNIPQTMVNARGQRVDMRGATQKSISIIGQGSKGGGAGVDFKKRK